MGSGRSDDFPGSSDEEEDFFAGFTVEEIGQMRQDRQRRREQELLRDVDEEIDALIDQEPQESASNSDVEVFADDGDEESGESSDEETASNADSDDAPPNPLQWSNTLDGINVEEFSVRHGPSRDLGDNAKKACAMCAKAGRKRKEGQGRTFETSYACEQCGVPLCRQMRGERSCFDEWHS